MRFPQDGGPPPAEVPVPRPLNYRHAVFASGFAPPTPWHRDVIESGARLFERLTVGVGINPNKSPLFTPQERLEILQQSLETYSNVDVACFEGLAVDFVRRSGAGVLLRGLRTLDD